MVRSYLTGVGGVVAIAVAWVGVQSAWRRVFPGASSDPDTLAHRMGCHGCSCTVDCADARKVAAQSKEELR